MADLHHALEGGKVREDIYILRKLHRGNEDDVISPDHAPAPQVGPPPPTRPVERFRPSPPAEEPRRPAQKPEPQSPSETMQSLLAFGFSTPPPADLEDLSSLIRWFLGHDRLIPNNLEILEEAHRILYGAEDSRTYERHLAWAIADDLRIYDSRDLLQQHLILLSTVYARALQALRRIGAQQPDLQSPADLPESQRQELWELCLMLGLSATRLRVESWIYLQQYGELPTGKRVTSRRKSSGRARKENHKRETLVI